MEVRGFDGGECHGEGRALAELAVDCEIDLVGLSNVLDDSQAQAGTPGIVLDRLLGTIILLKNAAQSVFTDTNTLISNLHSC